MRSPAGRPRGRRTLLICRARIRSHLLQGGGTGAGSGISQDLSLSGGTTYELSFVYNGGGGGRTTQIAFSVADASHTFLSASVDTGAMNVYGGTPRATYSASFTPTADTTATLKFVPNGTWSGGFIDAVGVSPVPEPQSAWMTLAGMLSLGAATFGRRRGQARASGMPRLDRHRQIRCAPRAGRRRW